MDKITSIIDLREIPNVGPATVKYLFLLGIKKPIELIAQNPYSMFEKLFTITDTQVDRCLADVFISAVMFMEGAPSKKWWDYTKERKTVIAKHKLKLATTLNYNKKSALVRY